jgi:hypothetical protein
MGDRAQDRQEHETVRAPGLFSVKTTSISDRARLLLGPAGQCGRPGSGRANSGRLHSGRIHSGGFGPCARSFFNR